MGLNYSPDSLFFDKIYDYGVRPSRYALFDSSHLCDNGCFDILYYWSMGRACAGKLKFWHILFFLSGLVCDAVGTGLMKSIAHMTHLHDEIHTVTGVIAILLMLIHAMWAIWTYTRGSLTAKAHFNRFSIFVWCIWLIPYFIGMYLGMSHR